jgi:iron complex transport system permease protein
MSHDRRSIPAPTVGVHLVLAGILVAVLLGSVFVGVGHAGETWRALWAGPSGGHADSMVNVVWRIRLPRILLAGLCGALLASAGVGFQGVLRNPLADPYITGIAGGAAVGSCLTVLSGYSAALWGFGAPAAAFVFAFGGALLVYATSRRGGRTSVGTFLLAGVTIGSVLWAIITLLLILAQQSFDRIVFWLMGSFALATWGQLAVAAVVGGAGIVGLWVLARPLNVYSLGEESAAHLGVDVERLKRGVLLFGSLATAAAVSVAGIIGFVGLIVPHIGRRIVGPRHGTLYPAAALMGATLLILADTAAHAALPPREIPVGVLTALIGAPFLVRLMRARM